MPLVSPLQVHEKLLAAYGPQHWWPADSPFEVMVGAILTQNTSWTNVQKAIINLKSSDMLDCKAIANCDHHQLAEIIRPSGFYRQKAERLQSFIRFYISHGQATELEQWPMHSLRRHLLGLHGIGPETADSILLYGLDKTVFVVDAYTRRLFVRLEHFGHDLGYDSIQHYFHQRLPESLSLFQEFHALIVEHAKRFCKTKPLCAQCPLLDCCPTAMRSGMEIKPGAV